MKNKIKNLAGAEIAKIFRESNCEILSRFVAEFKKSSKTAKIFHKIYRINGTQYGAAKKIVNHKIQNPEKICGEKRRRTVCEIEKIIKSKIAKIRQSKK